MVCLYLAYNEKLLCGSNWIVFENYPWLDLGIIGMQYIIFLSSPPLSVKVTDDIPFG